MHLLHYISNYVNNKLINKETYKRTIIKTHEQTYKFKYNAYMIQNKVNHVKLPYKVRYNWLIEFQRASKFNWPPFINSITNSYSAIISKSMPKVYQKK